MAVANTKSTAITNADATPPVLTNSRIHGGVVRSSVGTVETAAADDAASVYRLVRVPSNARIVSLKVGTDAITGANASDIGVYKTARDGGAVVDADFFATDVDISSATAMTEYLFEATATDIVDIEQPLWEKLGLSADPQIDYDIAVTVNDVTAAGTISGEVLYVI
jgi:hypothetical protein